jgi:hypothetical protein
VELSFPGVDDADAALLAQELRLALRQAGVPAKALSIRRSSSEHMALGTVLGINVEEILHALGAIGYLACCVNCFFEIASRRRVTPRISIDDKSIDIVPGRTKRLVIETFITPPSTPPTEPIKRPAPSAKSSKPPAKRR